MAIIDEIQQLLSEELGIPETDIQVDQPLEQYGVDSLALLELMFKLEDHYKIDLPDERVEVKTLQDVVNLVAPYIEAARNAPAES